MVSPSYRIGVSINAAVFPLGSINEIETVAIAAVKNGLCHLDTGYIQSTTIQQLHKVISQLSSKKEENVKLHIVFIF